MGQILKKKKFHYNFRLMNFLCFLYIYVVEYKNTIAMENLTRPP